MQVLTLEIAPSKTTAGNVAVYSPYAQTVLIDDTIANVKAWLLSNYDVPAGKAQNFINKGRETRTIWAGVRTFYRDILTPIA